MEMYDLTKKSEKNDKGLEIVSDYNTISFRLDSEQVPPVEDYDVGEELHLMMNVKVVSKGIIKKNIDSKKTDGEEYTELRFEVLEVGFEKYKEMREKANQMGIDKKDLELMEKKREERKKNR